VPGPVRGSGTRLLNGDPLPGTSQRAGKRLLFLDELAHVLGAGNVLDRLLSPSEAPHCQCAVVEEAASSRNLDQDRFYGGQ